MSEALEELWERIRSTPWLGALAEWLRDSPALYMVGGALLFGVIFLLVWRFGLRRHRDSVSRQLLAEIRELRRQGDVLAVGQRYETLGEPKRALEAYRRGGFHAEHAELLLREGRRGEAKRAARDLVLERTVAYKVLSADVTGAVSEPAELLKEARAAAQLSHPNVVQIYDAGRAGDGFFVVMEYVEGDNFASILQRRKLSVAGALRVGRQICAALEHAHGRRIVHRDLKPSNLIWTEAEKLVKLTDFGLARAFESSLGQVMTRAAGTPFYMAPEQIRGEAVDLKTDIYSFGCVLFELLCNRTPFTGGGSSIYHHLNSRPRDPRLSREEIPTPLASIILECLEKDPAKRPPSAAEVRRRLEALAVDTAAATNKNAPLR